LVSYDDKFDSSQAVNVVNKLITEDKVDAIVGENFSTLTLAFADQTVESNVPLIATASSDINVTKKGKNVFRTILLIPSR
jgi:branched-chain amino acid transport system substrate-binding protein